MSKKRLIVVGNKIDNIDRSKEVDSFDVVVRLNRCNNYGLTGTKTTILWVMPNVSFFQLLDIDNYINILKNTSSILACKKHWIGTRRQKYIQILEKANRMDLLDKCKVTDVRCKIFNFKEHKAPYSCFTLIYYFINNYDNNIYKPNEYDFYFCNIDIEKREGIKDIWLPEKNAEPEMFKYYKKWINSGLLKQLD